MDTSKIVEGIIGVIIGLVLIIIGLSAEMSCSVIKALGGQCYAVFGNLYAPGSAGLVPTILLVMGAVILLGGSAVAVIGAQR